MSKNIIYLTNIFIIDWDDTLFPTSWVNKNMINMNDVESVLNYKLYFIELDKAILSFLSLLSGNNKNGNNIYIVTNANLKWIHSCLNRLSNTKDFVLKNNIKIISARDMYSVKTTSPTLWKINAFKDVLNDVILKMKDDVKSTTFLNVISIGDADYEYQALINLDTHFKTKIGINYLLKSIKFIEKPNFLIVIEQIEETGKNFETIVKKIGYIDLKFVE